MNFCFRSWNRGSHARQNPKKSPKILVQDRENASQNHPTRKMTVTSNWRLPDPDVCAKFVGERYEIMKADTEVTLRVKSLVGESLKNNPNLNVLWLNFWGNR